MSKGHMCDHSNSYGLCSDYELLEGQSLEEGLESEAVKFMIPV